ncbi:MAG: hypothetical protein COX65_07735 [Elusimicrobia bacterium CG_4_10_14_0_2_um_filter_56_8]|nr:MAG: hypothetical protein AUJ51_12065 [Elusimicrobia bacterium CG1_02_56_21]PJA12992.1 MAG: hypothetical protein COX65_07735 [Elusimicrobia bacterium CG_4_10_14_0_2_um_filter_56_8]
MEDKNPFEGVKTCGNYTRLWQLTGFVLFLQVIVSVIVAEYERRHGLNFSTFEAIVPALLATGLVSWLMLRGLGVSWRAARDDWSQNALGDIKKSFKYFGGYVLVMLILFAGLLAAYWYWGDWLQKITQPQADKNTNENALLQAAAAVSQWRLVLVLFSACVVAPIVEEVFFRRIVYTAIRLKNKFWFSAFWSGLLFAVFHGAAAPFILPVGMYFCWVYERERRLPVNILLHSLVNLTMVTLKVLT